MEKLIQKKSIEEYRIGEVKYYESSVMRSDQGWPTLQFRIVESRLCDSKFCTAGNTAVKLRRSPRKRERLNQKVLRRVSYAPLFKLVANTHIHWR